MNGLSARTTVQKAEEKSVRKMRTKDVNAVKRQREERIARQIKLEKKEFNKVNAKQSG